MRPLSLDALHSEIRAHRGCGFAICEEATHLVPGEGSHSPEQWEALVREGGPEFTGEVVCGVDLDELAIGGGR